ncbi:MAG: hypothetical protein Q7U02_13535, partial [Desulfosalsimonadaceae bacterium]|nr:hypothetical protein [Desulfosalsimonadaceae bacterium]
KEPNLKVFKSCDLQDIEKTLNGMHIVWVVGNGDDKSFQEMRRQLADLRFKVKDFRIWLVMSIDMTKTSKIEPQCGSEACICINDVKTMTNLIHDVTCLWSFPHLVCVDFPDFIHILAGKNCKLIVFEFQKNEGLEELHRGLNDSGKALPKSSSAFIISAFDKSFNDNMMEYKIEILEAIYQHTEKNNDDFELLSGDTGWPSTISLEGSIRVSVIYN